MSWVRIDDHFYDHRKWADAPAESVALWLAAMAWCNRNDAFDGVIPANKLTGLVNVRSVKVTTGDLVKRHAFYIHERGYQIHEYTDYQQNDKVQQIRETRRANGKKGADARWRMANDGKTDGKTDGKDIANGWQEPWQTDGKQNAPPPTTHHPSVITSSVTPPALTLVGGGDNSRQDEVLTEYGRLAVELARARGVKITNAKNYADKASHTPLGDPDMSSNLFRWLLEFPTAPANAIACWLHGDKHSMRNFA